MRSRWFTLVLAVGLLAGASTPQRAHADEVALKSNETVPLFGVYWIANCKSILKAFAGIDVLEGPPGVSLSLKPGMVHAYRQKCSQPIRGATVMVKAGAIAAKSVAKLVFRVRYNTADGPHQSTHTVALDLYP